MRKSPDVFLEDAVLVVAHPDDEALWFSSILGRVDRWIVCFADLPARAGLGDRRRQALARHPAAGNALFLDLAESDCLGAGDWERPEESAFGLMLRSDLRSTGIRDRYRENFGLLEQRLAVELRGCSNVITHNPWGEYGHEEHVQVHRVVASLRKELGFRVWFSNYAGDYAMPLMSRFFRTHGSDGYSTLEVDVDLAQAVMELYTSLECWTWYHDWTWFDNESFMELRERDTARARQLFPINHLRVPLYARRKTL